MGRSMMESSGVDEKKDLSKLPVEEEKKDLSVEEKTSNQDAVITVAKKESSVSKEVVITQVNETALPVAETSKGKKNKQKKRKSEVTEVSELNNKSEVVSAPKNKKPKEQVLVVDTPRETEKKAPLKVVQPLSTESPEL